MADEPSRFQRTRDALAGRAPEAPADKPAEPSSLSGAADRIRQMLVTAEDVSEDIRREAQEEAERYLAKARGDADSLLAERRQHLERALEVLRTEGREIERRVAAVTAALEQALADPLVAGQAAEAPQAEAPAAETETAPEPAKAEPKRRKRDKDTDSVPPPVADADTEGPEDEAGGDGKSDGDAAHQRQRALIRATQLAVQGVERDEVQKTLDREFELDDTADIVDEILGSG